MIKRDLECNILSFSDTIVSMEYSEDYCGGGGSALQASDAGFVS